MKLSVVIPVLNERGSLPATIAALRACRGISEIIVSDGGSTDGTVAWLQAQPDIVLVRSIRGKGPQSTSAQPRLSTFRRFQFLHGNCRNLPRPKPSHASPPIALLFLHADCVISQPAIDALHAALADPQLAGGAFYIRFAESRPRSLRLVAWGINVPPVSATPPPATRESLSASQCLIPSAARLNGRCLKMWNWSGESSRQESSRS